MYLLITYDVSTESKEGRRRLRKIARTCLDYGQRVQKSVFECHVSETEYVHLQNKLEKYVNRSEDSIRIYRLRSFNEGTVTHMGINEPVDFSSTLIL